MPALGCENIKTKTGKYIKCEYCGKTVYKTLSQYNKRKHHFCSNKCQSMMKHSDTYEDRPCEMCGKPMHVSIKSTQRFCSYRCQNEWQKTRVGEDNPRYTRIEYVCDNCGTLFTGKAYKAKASKHHFCSKHCRQEWYANVWSQRQEWREESIKRAVNTLANNKITRSRPQIIVDIVLDSLHIPYKNEAPFGHYAIDNYLTRDNLAIEVMGDYWHCNPMKYENISNGIQWNAISRDISKHTYMQKYHSIDVLYLWEYDITNRINVVRLLINEYIRNDGKLSNYHSFNYCMIGGAIAIASNIITPYQDMSIDERKTHYIKTAS